MGRFQVELMPDRACAQAGGGFIQGICLAMIVQGGCAEKTFISNQAPIRSGPTKVGLGGASGAMQKEDDCRHIPAYYNFGKHYGQAVDNYKNAISYWTDDSNKHKRLRALTNMRIGLAEVQLLLSSEKPEKAKAKEISINLDNALRAIRNPELKNLMQKGDVELIEETEKIVLALEQKLK